jgi:DNA-binding LytR/AlgR family response regulator
MPVLSGLDVARELAGRCHIVFVTAYDDYAIAAFDEGAVDYVLKPPMPERIAKVVSRLKARLAVCPARPDGAAREARRAGAGAGRSSGSGHRSAIR